MQHKMRLGRMLALFALLQVALCDMAMEGDDYTRPDITHPRSKTAHWILSLFLSLLVPSVAAVLVFAERLHAALIFQLVGAVYAILDSLFLSFPDGDGVENRTSRGTGVTLALLSTVAVFFALVHSGSQVLLKKVSYVSRLGERTVRFLHRLISVLAVLCGWVRVCMAPVAFFGFCREKSTGQCIAHGIMGSAFVGYGFVYALVLVLPFFRDSKHPYTQDFYDSLIMTAWGIVNTFTEHRWGREPWGHGDFQHTAMGIIWWAGGLLGLFLARGGRRTFVPSLLLIFTGWAMSEHSQELVISTKVHYVFGLVLMTAGALRIIEIGFLLRDERKADKILSFQYLPGFCLVESGVLFMSANEEQLVLVLRLHADHSSYILVVTAAAFMIYLWMLLLLELYLKLNVSSRLDLADYTSVERSATAGEFELDDIEE